MTGITGTKTLKHGFLQKLSRNPKLVPVILIIATPNLIAIDEDDMHLN